MTTATPTSPKLSPKRKEKRNSFSSNFSRLNIPLHGVRLPSFKIEDRYINDLSLPKDISTYDFLRELCLRRFKHLGLDKGKSKKIYIDRIKYDITQGKNVVLFTNNTVEKTISLWVWGVVPLPEAWFYSYFK